MSTEKEFDYDKNVSEPAWDSAREIAVQVLSHFKLLNPSIRFSEEDFNNAVVESLGEVFKDSFREHYREQGAQV